MMLLQRSPKVVLLIDTTQVNAHRHCRHWFVVANVSLRFPHLSAKISIHFLPGKSEATQIKTITGASKLKNATLYFLFRPGCWSEVKHEYYFSWMCCSGLYVSGGLGRDLVNKASCTVYTGPGCSNPLKLMHKSPKANKQQVVQAQSPYEVVWPLIWPPAAVWGWISPSPKQQLQV